MKKKSHILFLFIFISFISSCGTLSDKILNSAFNNNIPSEYIGSYAYFSFEDNNYKNLYNPVIINFSEDNIMTVIASFIPEPLEYKISIDHIGINNEQFFKYSLLNSNNRFHNTLQRYLPRYITFLSTSLKPIDINSISDTLGYDIFNNEHFNIEIKEITEIQNKYHNKDNKCSILCSGNNRENFFKLSKNYTIKEAQVFVQSFAKFKLKLPQKIKEQKAIDKIDLIDSTQQRLIKTFVKKTTYFYSLNNLHVLWTNPQPYLGELLPDQKSIRFKPTTKANLLNDDIFLLTWDYTDSSSFDSSPRFLLNGKHAFIFCEYDNKSLFYKNFEMTFNLTSIKEMILFDGNLQTQLLLFTSEF